MYDYFLRIWRRAVLPLEAFSDRKPLTKVEGAALAGLINRKEFRLFEKYLAWKIAVKNAEGMRSDDDQVTHDRKICVNVLKEIPYDLRTIWAAAQPREQEQNMLDKDFKIFRDDTDENI